MILSKNHFILLGVFLILFDLGINTASKPTETETFVFRNANIIPMNDDQILENYSLVIKDGLIREIEPNDKLKIPSKATIIDASGKYLIPGLSDMHVHLEGQAWNLIYPEGQGFSQDELDYELLLFPYVANGITTLNVMSAFPEHIAIRDSIKKGKLFGPELVLSKMIDGSGKAWPPPISTWVNTPDEAKNTVIETVKLGYDQIKVYSFLERNCYDTIVKTAKEFGIPVVGHIPHSTSVEHIVDSDQKLIAHSEELIHFVEDFNESEINRVSTLLAENKIWMTPTLVTSQNIIRLFENGVAELQCHGSEYLHPQAKDIWNFVYQNLYKPIPKQHQDYIEKAYQDFQIPFVREFNKKGGKILAGTDALIPPTLAGYSLHDELKQLVKAGLSPYESLKTATINPHAYLKNTNAGTLEEGKLANLVMLEKNPLENISNTKSIAGVFLQNKWMSEKKIELGMGKIQASYNLIKKQRNL